MAELHNGAAVRDRKDRSGPILALDAEGWRSSVNSQDP
ncbi:hypothetical protein C1I95_22150 [Micromonospora craterilacus]|uniref:Uncharacterized protein n=1 Tax=Micromonospora craterilacus TaxID=1655439 RepID=A0A2W2DUT1_9ACTN|nr:hypothetical protein C1I95_22150 [Micromonospora craterilacus]